MATFLSPGIYVVENDNSNYIPSLNPSVVGIVGFATKGPTNEATLITDQDNLIRTFGEPSEDIAGQGLEGAIEILEATNSLYFVRAIDGGAEALTDVQLGSCPAIAFGTGIGVTSGMELVVNGTDSAGNAIFAADKTYTIASGYDSTYDSLKATFGTLANNKLAVYESDSSGMLALTTPGYKSTLSLSAGFVGDGIEDLIPSGERAHHLAYLDMSGNTQSFVWADTGVPLTEVVTSGITLDASNLAYTVESLYPGTGYNYLVKSNGAVRGNSVTVREIYGDRSELIVNDLGVQEELFTVTVTGDEDRFVETAINTGNTDETSDYIKGYFTLTGTDVAATGLTTAVSKISTLATGLEGNLKGTYGGTTQDDVNPRFVKFLPGTYKLAGGTDGIPTTSTGQATAVIGASTVAGKTGLYALDDDLLGITIAAVPGFHDQSVQNALISLAEATTNFLAVVAPPYGVGTVQDAIDWSNGVGTGDRTSAISSSWAAIYWPHVKVFNGYDGKDRWYDPSIFGIRQMCFTDDVSEAWFAPAGFSRGRLTKPSEVEVRVGQGDRDAMYSGGNVINPIVNFPQQGMVIFGQRTAQREASALDRINVRRMMIIIKKLLQNSTRQFAFEPNDPITWEAVADLATNLLDPIAQRRGISEYQVVCDSSTNTPDRIEKGELWCKVFIRPTKSAEIIVFELNLVDQQAAI